MDGPHRITRARRALTGLATLIAALLLVAPAPASADRASDWPATGAVMRAAFAIAVDHWGAMPCGGRVDVRWDVLATGTNADAGWSNPFSKWARPLANDDCEITLSTAAEWDWPKLCSVIVHEVGHLRGLDHVGDEHDLMFAVYLQPVPACADTPEPPEPQGSVGGGPPASRNAAPARRAAPGPSRARGRRAAPRRPSRRTAGPSRTRRAAR
jgi:hypothetical protein